MEAQYGPRLREHIAPDLTEYEGIEYMDLSADNWAAPYTAYCVEKGIMELDESGAFLPEEKITAGQFCEYVQNALGTEDSSLFDNVQAAADDVCAGTDAAEILMNALFFGSSYTETVGYRNFSLIQRPDIYDMPYIENGKPCQAMDVFYPEGEAPEGGWPVVIFARGGGFAREDKVGGEIEAFVQVNKYGYAMIAINYSDAVDNPLPYQILEGKAAVRYVRANAEALNINPDQIFISGGSAGAIIMSAVGATANDPVYNEMLADMNVPDVSDAVCGTILFYGEFDYTTMWGHKAWQAGTLAEYNPELAAEYDEKYADYAKYNEFFEDKDPGPEDLTTVNPQLGGSMEDSTDLIAFISPANYLNENTSPFFLRHGTEDPVLSFLQSVDFAQALEEAGVPVDFKLVEGKGHEVMFLEDVPTSEMVDWMNQILGK